MSVEAIFVVALTLAVLIAFIWERYPPEVIALGASAVLLATGILETERFLSVFSSAAPITIAMMFIISAALERTGVLSALGGMLQRVGGDSVFRTSAVVMLTVIIASAFMNNTPIVVVFTPIVIRLAGDLGISPSKLLIPLSFSAILGGTLTLIGTSTNILMSTVATQAGEPAIGMFEMTRAGLVFAVIGLLYMLVASRFLLPDRVSLSALLAGQPKRQFLAEVLIPEDSSYVGRAVADVRLGKGQGRILDVIRNNRSIRNSLALKTRQAVGPAEQPPGLDAVVLAPRDRLVVETNAGEVVGLKANGDIGFTATSTDYEPVAADATVTMQASIGYRSPLIGRRLAALNLRRAYGVYVLAVHRQDEPANLNFRNLKLEFGDTLLLEGPAEGMKRLLDDGAVINLSAPQERAVRSEKAPIALLVVIAVTVLAALDMMPIAGLAVIGAVVVMVSGCVDPDEAFESIDWRILFLIFGMLGLSLGLDSSGAARWIVEGVVEQAAGIGPVGVLAAVYVLTSALTEVVSNNAVAVLIGPIVIALAQELGLDPRPFIMAVMFAASASFATPIGYQTNTFVYGAGGYRFSDFLRIGIPMNVLFAVLAVVVLPLLFPF